ncbi:hypothetical protein VN12_26265 [Pirellula sp. SH-Sr6A]|uniref:DUF4376 domain-containing protein n=1 Tax=Pirellula sp. SH-Sr6A TaxID=1632865 RepID=UPI00078EEF74|nr:DUF4376 domain-containing protein [Pirellula sp. SH-Sr6A]AMV35624.1 hypothetical protein VN12_26265 [Pirellula sp. SH-Sr6A]
MRQFLTKPDGSLPDGITIEQLESLGLIPVIPTLPPAVDNAHVCVDTQSPVLSNGVWFQQWAVEPIETEELSDESLLIRLAEIRWMRESSGIRIGDQQVTTLREEMPVWQGMLLDITLRPGATAAFEYKPRGGQNVLLSPQQITRIYECFAWYVNACFATERSLVAQIGTISNSQILDLANADSTWPQKQFQP